MAFHNYVYLPIQPSVFGIGCLLSGRLLVVIALLLRISASSCVSGGSRGISDYPLRVEVCSVADELRESNCKLYQNNTSYKPTGILHDYGENDRMYFGLLTGSYQKNITGGVLHSNVSNFFSRRLIR